MSLSADSMNYLRKRSFIQRWVAVISLLLLLQGLFPSQTHSELVKGDDGRLTEVCTLRLASDTVLDSVDKSDQEDDQRSPAMMFSDLMAEAIFYLSLPDVQLDDRSIDPVLRAYIDVMLDIASALMPIRAPPLLMV